MGGAGTFAAVGARIAAGNENAESISFVLDEGSDFPPSFHEIVQSWGISCTFRKDTNRLTTRAWNGYDEDDRRGWLFAP